MSSNQLDKDYQIVKQGPEDVMRISAEGWAYPPSIENQPLVMASTMDKLVEAPSVSSIVFSQHKKYHYDYHQTQMLIEIANIYKTLVRQRKILTLSTLAYAPSAQYYLPTWRTQIQEIIISQLRSDPVGAYVNLKRIIREEHIKQEKSPEELKEAYKGYLDILNHIHNLLEGTQLIKILKNDLAGYHAGNREIYHLVFKPTITPDFLFTQLMAQHPLEGIEQEVYSVNGADVTVYDNPHDVKHLYHLTPPEFKLTEDKYELLETARTVLAQHQPREEEFLEPDKLRSTFYNIGKDLLQELADNKGLELNETELNELANILVRYTVGFGLVEVLLQDQKIQDISINSPPGQSPIFIVHQDYDDCVTNIIPSREDADSWATKFRILSGRPLDEANPILDTELSIPGARARVGIIQKPLNPYGIAYSFRRHRDKPWTLPLFMHHKMINPLGAGLLSFLIDGSRTLLFAGTRSSGKTSLLGSTLIEIMRRYRIITVEDTLELSVDALRTLGYNIQPMKVRSALTKGGTEIPADEGIRTSLRLGDSALIVGEIRSTEAFALYEAMRVGALANVVAGTIHGDSPYGVFDRVVNDLKVPATSFKATDIITVANPLRSPDGLHRWRRVVQITEVRKHWKEDPLREQGFVDLMKYNSRTDQLEPSQDLINGDSEIIKSIAGNVKEWASDWEAVWNNILLRAKTKEMLLAYSHKYNLPEMLEAPFVISSNDQFHKATEETQRSEGYLNTKNIYFHWEEWLKRATKQIQQRGGLY